MGSRLSGKRLRERHGITAYSAIAAGRLASLQIDKDAHGY
jgi:hypothetical protein